MSEAESRNMMATESAMRRAEREIAGRNSSPDASPQSSRGPSPVGSLDIRPAPPRTARSSGRSRSGGSSRKVVQSPRAPPMARTPSGTPRRSSQAKTAPTQKMRPISELRDKIDEVLGCDNLEEVDDVLKAISRHPEQKQLPSGPVLMLQQYATTLRARKMSTMVCFAALFPPALPVFASHTM